MPPLIYYGYPPEFRFSLCLWLLPARKLVFTSLTCSLAQTSMCQKQKKFKCCHYNFLIFNNQNFSNLQAGCNTVYRFEDKSIFSEAFAKRGLNYNLHAIVMTTGLNYNFHAIVMTTVLVISFLLGKVFAQAVKALATHFPLEKCILLSKCSYYLV